MPLWSCNTVFTVQRAYGCRSNASGKLMPRYRPQEISSWVLVELISASCFHQIFLFCIFNRIIKVGEELQDHQVQPETNPLLANWTMALSAMSSHFLTPPGMVTPPPSWWDFSGFLLVYEPCFLWTLLIKILPHLQGNPFAASGLEMR